MVSFAASVKNDKDYGIDLIIFGLFMKFFRQTTNICLTGNKLKTLFICIKSNHTVECQVINIILLDINKVL